MNRAVHVFRGSEPEGWAVGLSFLNLGLLWPGLVFRSGCKANVGSTNCIAAGWIVARVECGFDGLVVSPRC